MMLKDSAAVLPVEIDWSAQLATGDTISSATWSILPVEAGGLTVDSDAETSTVAAAIVSGGLDGRLYRLTNTIVTAVGYTVQRSIGVRIGATRAEAA